MSEVWRQGGPSRFARRVQACVVVAGCLFAATILSGQNTTTHGISIPPGEFMVYWTPERLAQARAWYQANRTTWSPRSYPTDGGHLDNAFVYLMTGNASVAQGAINWASTYSFYSTGPGNEARWSGENQILIFSWLKSLFTPAQRRATIESINRAIANDLQKSWGGPQDPPNNYNWGFTRNAILWGIASYNESYTDSTGRTQRQIADGFLDNALVTRWQERTAPFLGGQGRGGTMPEGSHYGPYLLDYFTMPYMTMRSFGRNLSAESNYFREAAIALIYSTTPKPTYGSLRHNFAPRYQVFSYGDEQDSEGHPEATDAEYGNFMTMAAQEYGSTPIGQYARYWLNRVRPLTLAYVKAPDAGAAQAGTAFTSLPLDYYAAGPGYFYTRDTWASGAADRPTVMLLQLGQARGSHTHCDAGTFQILRNDRWLTRETPGRSTTYTNYNATGSVLDMLIWSHNGQTVNNSDLGPFCSDSPDPEVLRLESHPQYAYAAVDLSNYSELTVAPNILREFVNVRALGTLVILDRVRSTQDVPKTSLIHFPTVPVVTGNTIVGTNGTEQLRVTALTSLLSGQTTNFRVIDESQIGEGSGGSWEPQYRLQIETRGALQTYQVTVLQAKGVADSDVTPTLAETAATLTVTLNRPGQAAVVLTFNKGSGSNGGSIRFGTQDYTLTSAVAGTGVTDAGVAWGVPPRPVSGVRIVR